MIVGDSEVIELGDSSPVLLLCACIRILFSQVQATIATCSKHFVIKGLLRDHKSNSNSEPTISHQKMRTHGSLYKNLLDLTEVVRILMTLPNRIKFNKILK